jgi:hypothetical protein
MPNAGLPRRTVHPPLSKKERLALPDIENADQSADDESDNDLQLAGAASSSKQGGGDISWQAR